MVLDYLERVAMAQPEISHSEGRQSFYVIEDSYDTDEFDQALRNFTSTPAMLTESYSGEMDDNESANYTDLFALKFMIVDRRIGRESVRAVRNRCLQIGKRVVVQMRRDRNTNNIVPGKYVNMDIRGVRYEPVGPMLTAYYGYVFVVEILVPFAFS